jgi:DNA-binding CsgD family transcriptional regulator
VRSELTDEQIRKLAHVYWSRWEAGLESGEAKAIDALERLDEKVGTDVIREARNQGKTTQLLAAALSPRELEVLQMLANVGNGRTVSAYLGISYETVRTYGRNIRLKLGAKTNTHAVAMALRAGIIK